MNRRRRTKIVFVCTGNICRSPMAEVVASQRVASMTTSDGSRLSDVLEIASAGTASWHIGEPMDPRAAAVLRAAGFNPDDHRAQHATDTLLADAEILVALDRKHAQILKGRVGAERHSNVIMLRPHDPASGGQVDIADPYYGSDEDFAECLRIISAAVAALVTGLAATID